jgi:hypothetical protein
VRAGAVPVAGDRLRVQGQHHSGNLSDPLLSISIKSESVSQLQRFSGSVHWNIFARARTSRM